MIWLLFGLSALCLVSSEDISGGEKSGLEHISASLKKHGVIPDAIRNPFKEILAVHFTKSNTSAELGNELTPTQVRQRPTITWKADEGSFYSIFMIDLDVPSRENPMGREWLHWFVGNIPGGAVDKGNVLAGYIPSAPPKGTGFHRYVFLVYKHPQEITFDMKHIPATISQGRAKFSTSGFAKDHNLGDPVAGNFYLAEWDETSEKIYETLEDFPKNLKMAQALKEHGIIPDVIQNAWNEPMTVDYEQSNVKADLGNKLTPSEVKLAPKVSWKAEEGSYYVLCMTDPDAPSRAEPTFREFLHWLVVNVPGKNLEQGTVLAGYRGSGPPKGTGLHRYIFVAYKQQGKLNFDEKPIPADSREDRRNFAIAKFAKKYNLGDPVAGNFFQAQFEEQTRAQRQEENKMAALLKEHGVIPDVIDTAWQSTMSVDYVESKVKVELGNELTPSQVKQAPKVTWEAKEGSFYTICMTDPDAPSRNEPTYREILHWLVVNVPGNNLDQGTLLAGYRGSGPPKGTGLHRYIFLAYKQTGKLTFDEKFIPSDSREGRPNFAVAKFAKKYNLGNPVAGNFFQAQFEE